MKIFKLKHFFILFLLVQYSKIYSQYLPIIGFGDQANYRIDYFSVPGSAGLDLHWYGGIRFGDKTGNSVMQITDGKVGIGTITPQSKLHSYANLQTDIVNKNNASAYLQGQDVGVIFGQYISGGYGSWVQSIRGTDDTPFPMSLNPIGGNVGIGLGSNTPIFKLDILGPNGNGVKYKGESGVENVLGVSASAGQIGTISNNRLDFLVAGTEKVSISTGGNVGIGTFSPTGKLQIDYNPSNQVGILLNNNTGAAVGSGNIQFADNGTLKWNLTTNASNDFFLYNQDGAAQGANLFINKSNGYVGLGTANPLAKLEVSKGNILVRNSSNIDNESTIMIAHSINIGNLDTFGTSIRTVTQSAGSNSYGMQFFTQESYLTNQTEKLRILGNGNVGIGITNPNNKLDVNGTIHSKEVKVDMNGWSDFVFKKEYDLPTLEEVEKQITEKGHLKDIPSEQEVLKNGINLGEMNAKLLQKIEELTLYMIEMKKENEAVKNENRLMKNNQTELEKRMSKIENK